MESEYLYMKITNDKYKLPITVADSPKELAEMTRTNSRSITTMISKHAHGKLPNSQYIKVRKDDGK